jgi:hypothetical protein
VLFRATNASEPLVIFLNMKLERSATVLVYAKADTILILISSGVIDDISVLLQEDKMYICHICYHFFTLLTEHSKRKCIITRFFLSSIIHLIITDMNRNKNGRLFEKHIVLVIRK